MATQDKWEKQHLKSIAKYERLIKQIYDKYVQEAARIGADITSFDASNPLAFDDYPLTRKRIEALQKHMASDIEAVVFNGIDEQWALADGKTSALIATAFAGLSAEELEERKAKYLTNRDDAREAFKTRKENGINISDRVWRYTDQFKEEIEMGIDLGLRDGKSADALSRDLRKYLNNPNMLFRRVRDEHGVLHLSKRAKAYHPGQGVYRSSYKNARRLAATETNIAYRTADHDRVQDLDFVVGIRVNLSNNHTLNGEPFTDICDELSAPFGSKATKGKGCYPKDFKFTGWHPLCRCFITTILKTEEEMDADDERIMSGDEPTDPSESKNYVEDVPDNFKTWSKNNAERVERAKSVPYFIRDNQEYYNSATLNAKTSPTSSTSPIDIAKQRHADRTATEAQAIRDRWHTRQAMNKGFSSEQLANFKALEKVLNINREMPMPFGLADKAHPNPHYTANNAQQLGYHHNCQTCTVAFEMRRRGFDVEANSNKVAHTMNVAGKNVQFREIDFWRARTGLKWEQRFMNADGTDAVYIKSNGIANTVEAKRKFIESNAIKQGRYEVYCRWNNESAHVFILERQKNGNLVWYDPQTAAIDVFKERFLQSMVYDDIWVMRIDDKLINPKFAERLSKAN